MYRLYLTIGGVWAEVSIMTGVKFPVKLEFCTYPLPGTKPVPWMSPELWTSRLKKGTRHTYELPFTTGSVFIWFKKPVGILSTGAGAGYNPPVDICNIYKSLLTSLIKIILWEGISLWHRLTTKWSFGKNHGSVSVYDNLLITNGSWWSGSNIQHNFSSAVIQFCLIL